MKGPNTDFDSIEKEFKYTKEFMCLMKEGGKVNTDEFKVGKEVQEENVRDLLTRLTCTVTARRCDNIHRWISIWQSRTNRSWWGGIFRWI